MILNLFAGPGGWEEGLAQLGCTDVIGIENEDKCLVTRLNAKHKTYAVDVEAYEIDPSMEIEGLIASPPCQSFTNAGNRLGLADPRGQLVFSPIRYIKKLNPEWVVFEEVPAVLGIWASYGAALEQRGYNVWVGELNCWEYGVPQLRRRAILLASRTEEVGPPPPTHTRENWVTMASALDIPEETIIVTRGVRPERTKTTGGGNVFQANMPSWTLTRTSAWWKLHIPGEEPRYPTFQETLKLQTFREDYPMYGSIRARFQQMANAVPPTFAREILRPFVEKS